MANERTQVSGSIGTAQQFMPNAPQVYQQNLSNVASVGAPMARFTNASDMLATGLSQLGVAWRQYTHDEEERKEKIAKAVAPQLYSSLTEEQKEGLTTRQLLATSGKFNLQDNEYAVATIDRMRGTEMGKRIESDWQIYDDQHKQQPDLPRQFNTFDEFYEARLKDYMAEENIENQYAFQNGLEEQHIATKMAVYDTFTKRKENQLKLERINGITAMVGDFARNNPNISVEEGEPYLQAILTNIRETATSDSNLEYKLLGNVADAISKTGNADLVSAFGELEYDERNRVKDMIDLSEYKNGANAEAVKIRNDRFVALSKDIEKIKTLEGLDEYYEQKKGESPEDYRLIAPLYSHAQANIKTEIARQQKLALMKQKAEVARSNANAVLQPMFDAMLQGKASWNGMEFPRTEGDLKNMGIDVDMFIGGARELLRQRMVSQQYDGLQYVLANPLIGGAMRTSMKEQLEVGLASMDQSGNLPEVVGLAVAMYRARPNMIHQLMEPKWAGRIQALGSLQDSMGEQQGTQIFAMGMQALRDPSTADKVKTEINKVPMGRSEALNLRSGTWGAFSIPDSTPDGLLGAIRDQAEILNATGRFTPNEAMEKAKSNLVHSYVNYDGVLLPRSIVDSTGVSSEAFASEGLRHVLDSLKSEAGSGSWVSYDPDQDVIYVRQAGSVVGKAYSPQDIGYRAFTYLSDTTAEERASEGTSNTVVYGNEVINTDLSNSSLNQGKSKLRTFFGLD